MALGTITALMAGTLIVSQILPAAGTIHGAQMGDAPVVSAFEGELDTGLKSKLDTTVVQKLPDGLAEDDEISVIVKTTDEALLSAYDAQSSLSRYETVVDFTSSAKGAEVLRNIRSNNNQAKALLEKSGVRFSYAADYDTLLGGFEVVLKAGDYFKLKSSLSGSNFEATISEVYAEAEAQLVENDVNVYETGIFKNDSQYDGTGTVIAVLDTGLDYTHTAFDPARFTSDNLVMTPQTLSGKISSLRAAETTPRLSAADVYINEKVPYGYDYADSDSDVYPLESEHGTHVSGIIVGNDDEIIGVAPNAQLAFMKVFSDTQTGAKWSWILAALEDCVKLEVDVINMSLGSSAGFTEESEDRESQVYSALAEHGISLVAAASNDYNSSFSSEKNGNLGLTSNPDSATIGSPGSYASALAVASISGVKTSYLTFNNQIMYFTESADAASETRNFVDDLLPDGVDEQDFEYVTIKGVGRSGDYEGRDVTGKIALVRRGDTTFEEKARIAQNKGAIGVIIYNNVSGDITMTVGNVTIAVCSISQDNGEMLAAQSTGKIHISRSQVAGPFMSNFSSWGPTPDLRIKPEITAHGGDILSAIPGQDYDRLSGTSMAAPNQAGVTALIRQYVKEKFPQLNATQVMERVNQMMMSTTDIAYNVNGLPYSVRKQGAGLANLTKSTTAPAFITTFARNDASIATSNSTSASARFTNQIIDKAKIEFGDDKLRSGDYELKFNIVNISSSSLSYDVGAIVMTEGVSKTKTHKGATTVTEEGYILEGAKVTVESVSGNGTNEQNSNVVTVAGNGTATVVVRILLSDSDKQYLDQSFENGMYVEGFVTLKPTSAGNTVSLNVLYLAFYGDWTEAPIFDLDYFETDKDDRDNSIATLDKTLPDVFATIPMGGLYDDYISYLGSYYFVQDPSSPQISADRKYVSMSNQEDAVNYIYGIYAGMLRGAKRVEISVTDSTTGEVIWTKTEYNQRKSVHGGTPSFIDVDFRIADLDLKNNTQYVVRAEAYLDYPGEQQNKRDVFEFPFVTDFQAPVLTDVEFYTEIDRSGATPKTKLFARAYIYDNHYAMAADVGYVYEGTMASGENGYILGSFNRYLTPIQGEFNSTTEVVFELTDHIGNFAKSANKDTFVLITYDYAMNSAYYEVRLPDSIRHIYFSEMQDAQGNPIAEDAFGVTLVPNEVYTLDPQIFPATEWKETLEYTSSDENVVRIVDGKLYAVAPGTATVTATSPSDPNVSAVLTVKVRELAAGELEYDKTVVKNFRLTGYETNYAFYFVVNSDREIGLTGSITPFSASQKSFALSMFPSEQVTINYLLETYFPDDVYVEFISGNENIVKVDENGKITAVTEGISSVTVRVIMNNKTEKSEKIDISVKNPYERNGPYLMRYTGGGDANGTLEIPESLAFTEIYQYAFSGYEYIPKFESEGDVITEEDPSIRKPWYHGDNQDIKKIVIPEGVETIGAYAFAGMKNLYEIVLPSTLRKISAGAFMGCTSLSKITGLEHVKFVNKDTFAPGVIRDPETYEIISNDERVPLREVTADQFASMTAIGDNAFRGTGLTEISLPATAQSIGAYAFAETNLAQANIAAGSVQLGKYAFMDCRYLLSISINAAVIPDGVFLGCELLKSVTLGRDVESVGLNAFTGTSLETFNVRTGNPNFSARGDGAYLLNSAGDTLVYTLPNITSFALQGVTKIGANAFSGNARLVTVNMPDVTSVGNNAFYGCTALRSQTLRLGTLEEIGDYAFAMTNLTTMPQLSDDLKVIGNYAFARTNITSVTLGDGMVIGEGAFFSTNRLTAVTIGNNATIGFGAFQSPAEMGFYYADNSGNFIYNFYNSDSSLTSVTIGDNANIGAYAFSAALMLKEVKLGAGAIIGEGAFYLDWKLESIDLSKAVEIGDGAFTGAVMTLYQFSGGTIYPLGAYGAQAPALTEVDLSSLEKLGNQAFGYNLNLASVKLGRNITEIPALAFINAPLTEIDLSRITSIGEGAFFGASLEELDLSRVDTIGPFAFASNAKVVGGKTVGTLTAVELKNGVRIEDSAFEGNSVLASVINLDKAVYIGASAFEGTALSGELNLAAATYVGDYAFAQTGITNVVFGEDLEELGENPFLGCAIGAFTKTENEIFNGQVVGSKSTTTFEITDTVQVINGALYQMLENGKLELVSYPMMMEHSTFAVEEGTARISSYAFAGSNVSSVELPSTLLAIGDKAFYGCENLKVVTFKSIKAPILEEQFDVSWQNTIVTRADGVNYIPIPGALASNGGSHALTMGDGSTVYAMNILKYAMWNLNNATYFYGANFQDYIGLTDGQLVMIRPLNGTNYDSFIYSQYFAQIIDGPTAAEDATLAAIAAIAALPDRIALTNEEQVVAARALYNMIATTAQQALVTNYSKLTSAENTINYLKRQQESTPPEQEDPLPPEPSDNGGMIAIIVTASVLGAAAIAGGVAWFFMKKKKNEDERDE